MVRGLTLLYGVAFLVMGVCGFIPGPLVQQTDPNHTLHVNAFEGYLFGLFHVNALHSAVHVLFGVLGLLMARSFRTARGYLQLVAVSYILLAVLGLIPGTNTLFGLVPLHGNDVWLHLALALPAAIVGFGARRATTTTVVVEKRTTV